MGTNIYMEDFKYWNFIVRTFYFGNKNRIDKEIESNDN